MAGRVHNLRAAFAFGILFLAGLDPLAGSIGMPPDLMQREAALIEQVRLISRSDVFYLLIDLADPEPPGELHEQLSLTLDNRTLDPSARETWLLLTLSVFIARSESEVEATSPSAEIGAAAPPPGEVIAAGYIKLEEWILGRLNGHLHPEVLDAFRERFATLGAIDISRWKLEEFSRGSYAALGELLDADRYDDHVRRLYSTLVDVHQRLQMEFGQQLLTEMDEIESRWRQHEISTTGKREAYRSMLERIHREIAQYKALREIAFTLETRIDLQAPQRYYLRALGRAFEFNKNSGQLHDDEFVTELARVVTRHMAEWHIASRLLFITTLLAEGPEGMHQWMYGSIDCHRRDAIDPPRMTVSKTDRYVTNDCACASNYADEPDRFAICCEGYKRRRFRENWYHLEVIFQEVALYRGSKQYEVGAPRHASVANVFAEAISSRIVTDHTDLIDVVHRSVRCMIDPGGLRSCPAGMPPSADHIRPFGEKLREPPEGAVIVEAIGKTIGAISLDPGMPDRIKLEKIEQMAEILVLLHSDEALATLLELFDDSGRGRVAKDRRNLKAALESVLVTKLREFVQLDRLVDPEQRRLTSVLLDHLLLKCREVSLDPYGKLYDYRYISALGRIKGIQPRLRDDPYETIERDDLINDIVTYHASNPRLFVSSVFHLSALLMDFAEDWTFWNSGGVDPWTRQAAQVFEVLSWINSSLGRAEVEGKVVNVVLSSDHTEEVRIVTRAYDYFTPRTSFGRTTIDRDAPSEFYEAVLPLLHRWIHLLPRNWIDRMRDDVIRPLTAIAKHENAEARFIDDRREFLTDEIKSELAKLVALIEANHKGDAQDRALSRELDEHMQRATQRKLAEQGR